MKLILAIIQPTRLPVVLEALKEIQVQRMTICDAQGYARQRGQKPVFRGHHYSTPLLRKVTLEIAVNDDFLDRTIRAIELSARSGEDGEIGDGKVFVLPLDNAIQIDTQQEGPQAI